MFEELPRPGALTQKKDKSSKSRLLGYSPKIYFMLLTQVLI